MIIFILTIIIMIILLLITGTALSLPTIGSQRWLAKSRGTFLQQAAPEQASKHLVQTQSGFCKHKQQRRRPTIGRGGGEPTNQGVVRTRRKLRRLASTEGPGLTNVLPRHRASESRWDARADLGPSLTSSSPSSKTRCKKQKTNIDKTATLWWSD